MEYSYEGRRCIAFADGVERIASGSSADVVQAVRRLYQTRPQASVLAFDETSSEPVELDALLQLPAAAGQVAMSAAPAANESAPRNRGRPRLGVVSREVTLLPRHWDWLNAQPGGASVVLRRLVDQARIADAGRERLRLARESAWRFMSAIAGNRPQFEEAGRALFADEQERLAQLTSAWPADVREHLLRLAAGALEPAEESLEADAAGA
jgi:hypothetical protein